MNGLRNWQNIGQGGQLLTGGTWERGNAIVFRRRQRGETPEAVIYPQTVEALTEVMQIAHEWGVAVIPMGAGSKLHWGGVVQQAPWVISTRDLDRLVEHAVGDLTVTVEAGAKLRTVEEILAKSQQFLAIDPIYADDATIGGIVATGDMGKLATTL